MGKNNIFQPIPDKEDQIFKPIPEEQKNMDHLLDDPSHYKFNDNKREWRQEMPLDDFGDDGYSDDCVDFDDYSDYL